MALPSSGQISVSQINTELGHIPATGNIWFSHEWLRNLAQRPSGAISMSDFHGKAAYTPMSLSSDGAWYTNTSRVYQWHYVNIHVSVANGKPGYSYLWEWENAMGTATLDYTTSQDCRVGVQSGGGAYSGVLRVRVTDSTGTQVWLGGIYVQMEIGAY